MAITFYPLEISEVLEKCFGKTQTFHVLLGVPTEKHAVITGRLDKQLEKDVHDCIMQKGEQMQRCMTVGCVFCVCCVGLLCCAQAARLGYDLFRGIDQILTKFSRQRWEFLGSQSSPTTPLHAHLYWVYQLSGDYCLVQYLQQDNKAHLLLVRITSQSSSRSKFVHSWSLNDQCTGNSQDDPNAAYLSDFDKFTTYMYVSKGHKEPEIYSGVLPLEQSMTSPNAQSQTPDDEEASLLPNKN